jgi:hypothetical protein
MRQMENLKSERKFETLLCFGVGTASHEHGFEPRTAYGRSGIVIKNDKIVSKLCAPN